MKTWDIDDKVDAVYEMRMAEVNNAINNGGVASGGITVRDYFAIRLFGVAAKAWENNVADMYDEKMEWDDDDFWFIAEKSYRAADAMMAHRNNPPHKFTEQEIDEEIAALPPEGIDVVVKDAFGV